MTHRVRGSDNISGGPFATGLCAWLLVVCFAMGVGCGNGDDSVSVLPLLKDGGADAADATASSSDAAPIEASAPEAGPREGGASDATVRIDAGVATAKLSATTIAFGNVNCSGGGVQTLKIGNVGTAPLTVSASATGPFVPSPQTLLVAPGGSEALTITATVPGSATAGTPLVGSLSLFMNDVAQSDVAIPLSVTPAGATIVAKSNASATIAFASSEVNTPSPAQPFDLENIGNVPATLALSPPNAPFSLLSIAGEPDAGPVTVAAGATVTAVFGFTPTSKGSTLPASSGVTVTGVTCGTSLPTVSLTGAGATGTVIGYQKTIDFGNVECGATGAPPPQLMTLTNTGTVDAVVTKATVSGPAGFTTSAVVGAGIPANGGTLTVAFTAPLVPSPSPLTPAIQGTVVLQTDADPTPQTITLTESPHGAILAFVPSPTFGSFGQAVLLQGVTQTFNVTNVGNEAAGVTLVAAASAGFDAGAEAPATFSVSNGSFTLPAGGTQAVSATYTATATSNQTGTLSMTATGTLCAPLQAPILLSGSGIGGGPSVAPTSLAFAAMCGAPAPTPQTFTVSNNGTADMTWAMSAVTGQGATTYDVSATPSPGTLHPGDAASITVTAAAVPSPAVNTSPASYAAQITVTTDVPFDEPHVVTLGETPLGDQLSFSAGFLRFGQIPIGTTTQGEAFTVKNGANVGSAAANFSLGITGPGASGFSATPATVSNLAPGGGVSNPVFVTFAPSTAATYPADIGIATTDSLCTPLPSPVGLGGVGTQAKVSISAATLAFGSDANDPKGFVNCGTTGLPQTITVTNSGNQSFQITALSLGLGASSPYVLSGPGDTLPATVPIHGSTTITVTPNAIPSAVANPNDPSPFADVLTVTTNAAMDPTHAITLVMQARGAVIADTPVAATWNFGTVGGGSIGTVANTITNSGNAPATIAFTGLKEPSIFGLQNNPTTAAANAVTPVIGEFTPPAANGQWNDTGTLVVTASQALCEPLPAGWTRPQISVSGSSNGDPPVTIAGTLTFPSSDCGSTAPAGQPIVLTNHTNQTYPFSATFTSGAFYSERSSSDAGAGTIPASGSATVVVTPTTVTPGPTVRAGAAPYVDDLVITIQSSPLTTFTVPISWTLNGAVLSLPEGGGPNTDSMRNAFYAADTSSGLELPMMNSGTAAATVAFGVQPPGAFSFSPAGAIAVQPGITALPRLTGATTDANCPALTPGSVTFLYTGPVCQPFPVSKVNIQSCVGTF